MNNKLKKILIFGKIPPPMGGVTVSVKNLIGSLESKGVIAKILTLKTAFKRYDVAHIHYSNLWKRSLGVLLAKFLAKKVIFTVHGKYLSLDKLPNKISMCFTDGVILLNQSLYEEVCSKSNHSNIIVLPSLFKEGFSNQTDNKIHLSHNDKTKLVLLYAYDRTYHNSEEIYGVEFVIKNLEKLPENIKLVIIDISGKYRDLISPYENRIIYINEVVDFIDLLKQVDVYIRPTCMDGASVAVQEAQLLGVPVLASDVVDRPKGVNLYKYKDFSDFQYKLENISTPETTTSLESVNSYINFCNSL